MTKTLYIPFIVGLLAFAAYGQKISKPTQIPKPATADQSTMITQGIAFHDAKKYDEAAAKYEAVLVQNPDCTQAIYELSMTLYAKGDKEKAMETANRGSKYISDELPLFYGVMASVLDDMGKPAEALKIYQDGIKLLEGNDRFGNYRSTIYYNMGVTYLKQNKYNEARTAFKSAVENNFGYASPNYFLAEVFFATKYKIPALLAASRFITLDFTSQRSKRAAAIINQIANAPAQQGTDGKITINLDISAPTDEGEFGPIELILAANDQITEKEGDDAKKNLTAEERFADRIDTVISLLDVNDKKNSKTFVAINYFPFLQEMKAKGYVKPFAYVVSYVSGSANAEEWVNANGARVREMLAWAKAYQRPAK